TPGYPATVGRSGGTLRQELQGRLGGEGWLLQGGWRSEAAPGQTPQWHGEVQQAYYDGQGGDGWGWTLGRKVLASPLGFGFRPLDLIQQENRRSFNPLPLRGVPLLALERLRADAAGEGASSLVASFPEQTPQQPALTWRRFENADSRESHLIGQYQRGRGWALGGGLMATPDADSAWHAALLWRQQGEEVRHALLADPAAGALATDSPLSRQGRGRFFQAVAGWQWTSPAGWEMLAEAWYDGAAWGAGAWRALQQLSERQRQLAGLAPAAAVAGNLAWNAQSFQGANLLPWNLLLRLTRNEGDRLLYIEALSTPEDGGQAWTLGGEWRGDRQRWRLGWRHYAGPAASAFAQLPIRQLGFVSWQIAF
ncbi:MAG: hypothetical protein RIR00_892, partial [Pseudomonadota bacterium]